MYLINTFWELERTGSDKSFKGAFFWSDLDQDQWSNIIESLILIQITTKQHTLHMSVQKIKGIS